MDLMKGKRGSAPKENAQWTLADWLSERTHVSLLDQWLAMHRSSQWIELDAQASQLQYDLTKDAVVTHETGQNYRANLYVSFVDFYGEIERHKEDEQTWAAAGGLRLLGANSQTTSLVGRYGVQSWKTLTEKVSMPLVEGDLQLYILSQFGLTGNYRYCFPATSNLGNVWEGHRWTAGVFFELGFLRVFGNYFWDAVRPAKLDPVEKRDGFGGGLGVFF